MPKFTFIALALGMAALGFVSGVITNSFDPPEWLRQRPKRAILVSLTIVILMTAGGWRLDSLQKAEDRRQEIASMRLTAWREPSLGISFGYPAAWTNNNERGFHSRETEVSVSAPGSDGTVVVQARLEERSQSVASKSSDDSSSTLSERRALAEDSLRVLEEATIHIFRTKTKADLQAGRPAESVLTIDGKRFDWTTVLDDDTIRGITVFVPVDNYWFRVDASAPIDSFEQYRMLFENVVLSITWA